MNEQLIHKSAAIHQQNLLHCKEFKHSNVSLTTQGEQYWKNKDVARLPAAHFFKKYINQYNIVSNKLLTFGAKSDVEIKLLNYNEWVDCDYWIDRAQDVEDLSNSKLDKNFDFCLINQAFEHLTNIESAIININNHLKTGGYLYCNFPVLNIPHAEPYLFFTGITVQYIIYLCIKNGFDIVTSGQWGNQQYIEYIYKHLTWPDYTQINLDCDNSRPCIGWVLARKSNI